METQHYFILVNLILTPEFKNSVESKLIKTIKKDKMDKFLKQHEGVKVVDTHLIFKEV